MCGFAGIFGRDISNNVLSQMIQTMHHRGPDSQGTWSDRDAGIGLGHVRLAIQDLSPAGNQPMCSKSGRYVIAFNGEIYNHLSLRGDLEESGNEVRWRGSSDTETLLAAIESWGVESTLSRCVGMFAFGLWDKKLRTLTLARDRLGEKPLYYGWQNGIFLFGSELVALRAHPAFQREIDRDSLTLLLRYSTISSSYSIYKGISKLTPGSILVLEEGSIQQTISKYWSLRDVAEYGENNPYIGNDDEAIDKLDGILKQAVSNQMLSDVPLGAFLSGGTDSSTVVALMQSQSSVPIKTFSIGFHEKGYNEAEHAKKVANHLGTDHTELYVTSDQAMNVVSKLPQIFSEPFADVSQIPTYLVSQLAKQSVTVSLSGDGGDELFGGYNRHTWVGLIWGKIKFIPVPIRKLVVKAMLAISPANWDQIFHKLSVILPNSYHASLPGDKIHKLAGILASKSPTEIYKGLVSHWSNPSDIVLGSVEPITVINNESEWADLKNFENQQMYLDSVSYLTDDILAKVDRAAMSMSLETRIPMLDHRVVEFAWSLPTQMKIREGNGKWILKQLLYKYVPQQMMERPKMGFAVPIDSWLRGPLNEWAEELLTTNRLKQEGYFNPDAVRSMWLEHQSGRRNWQYCLWNILMFQAWLENQ